MIKTDSGKFQMQNLTFNVNVKISDLSLETLRYVEFINSEVNSDMLVVLRQRYNIDDESSSQLYQGKYKPILTFLESNQDNVVFDPFIHLPWVKTI